MSETTFTPGPWRAVERDSTKTPKRNYWHIEAGRGYYADENSGFELMGFISAANAHLISAAPELYEALDDLVSLIEDGRLASEPFSDDGAFEIALARKALAKARGEAP